MLCRKERFTAVASARCVLSGHPHCLSITLGSWRFILHRFRYSSVRSRRYQLVPMGFGYGVGDFITITALAWNVYKSCKGAPESFGDISSEVLSLHAVLKEAEETVFAQPLSPTKQKRLKAVGDGCYRVLEDLEDLCKKYQSLGTQGRRVWDRMRWGTEDIAELRARLTSNTGLLTAWIRCVRLRDPIISHADANLVARLKPMLRRHSMTFCKSLRKENEKGQLFPL
jgi:hypothetical protein